MRPAGALTCAAVAEELKGKLGIEPTARAEELLVADFCRIAGSSLPQGRRGQFAAHCLRVLPDDPMLLTGGSVIARRHMRGLDEVRDLEAKLVRRGFLGEATHTCR